MDSANTSTRPPPHDSERLPGEPTPEVARGEVVVRGGGRPRHSVEHGAGVVEGAASEVEDEELDGEVRVRGEARRDELRVEGLRLGPRRGDVDEGLDRAGERRGCAEVARDARGE
nr:unnamed protein product [Digitaria exilis]